MTEQKILSEEPITMSEVKSELAKIKKRDGELSFRANKTEDYLNQFVELSPKKIAELQKKIEDLKIPRLKDQYIMKVLDLLPTTFEEVKLIFQQFSALTVTQENMKKIAKTVNDFLKK